MVSCSKCSFLREHACSHCESIFNPRFLSLCHSWSPSLAGSPCKCPLAFAALQQAPLQGMPASRGSGRGGAGVSKTVQRMQIAGAGSQLHVALQKPESRRCSELIGENASINSQLPKLIPGC